MIVGIVGSPRKNGLTSQLVEAALDGAKLERVEVQKVYLTDFNVEPYVGTQESCPEALNKLCEDADALILGSPVYWGDVSGLIKSFMETVRISDSNGKPALGISIAGGTGKGLLSGIQTIYRFFYHKRMRGIDPSPVSRFNLQETRGRLLASGRQLVLLSRNKQPFHNLCDVTEHYQSLPFLNSDILDEFMMLVMQLLNVSKSNQIEDAKGQYEQATKLIQSGDRVSAVSHVVKAYETLFFRDT